MNDMIGPVRFVFWVGAIVLAIGFFGSIKKMTYHMAEAAIEAQEHSMSYGAFSRTLWEQPSHPTKRRAQR